MIPIHRRILSDSKIGGMTKFALIFIVISVSIIPVQAQHWGPGITVDHWHDNVYNKDQTNIGFGVTWYNEMSDYFHGYASMQLFNGSSDSKKAGLYATVSIVLAVAPFGSDRDIVPYIGGGAAVGGINGASPVLATGFYWSSLRSCPYVQFEYFTDGTGRPALTIGFGIFK